MALTWEQHQKNIFGGESGGDYDALFGYQNRPNGAFAGVKVSQMPVGDVIKFTSPSGKYGQYVKGQVGRVATPVGAYQVVGTTLRDAVKALGIDPNQKFDKATQDKIGQYILKTQGTGAWEGYGKGGASMQNKPAQMFQEQQPQQQGLLGGLLGGRGIGGALGLSDDMRDKLRMGILAGSDPRAFQAQIANAQQAIATRRQQRQKQAGRNATADYLDSIGQSDAARLLREGAIDPATALSTFAKPPKTSASEAKIKRIMETGIDRNTAIAIADGIIGVDRDPVTGALQLINKATGQAISNQGEVAPADTTDTPPTVDQAQGQFDEIDVAQGLGLGGWARSIANTVTDAIGQGQAFPEAGAAAAGLDNLQTRTVVMAGVDIAGKPSNFTRQEIKDNLTVSASEISEGPEGALKKTQNMVRLLQQTYNAALASSEGKGGASVQQQRDARASLSVLEGLLTDYKSLEAALSKKISPPASPAVDPETLNLMNSLLQQSES